MLPTLGQVLDVARRYVALVLVAAVVGALVGWAVAASRPDRYAATATVLLPIPPYAAGSPERIESLDTLARLAYAEPVVAEVARVTRTDPDEAAARISVSAVPLTRLLRVQVVGSTPEQAARAAQVAGRTIVDTRVEVFNIGGAVVGRAAAPDAPLRQNAEVVVVSGALLGMLAGLTAATLRVRLSPTPRRTGLAVLAPAA
jgi:uncharacterized protein involved in exopolysaccharide biosynthesis